jgi:hypothetical protein
MSIILSQPSIGDTNWGNAINDNWQIVQNGLNSLTPGRNKIHNGDMSIWQRGISKSTTGGADYLADRWLNASSGSGVVTSSQSTTVPPLAETDVLFAFSNKMLVTTSDPSITGNDWYGWRYVMEGYDLQAIAGRACTLSFWFKSNRSGIYSIGLNNGNGGTPDRGFVKNFSYTAQDWERITLSIPVIPTSGTWNYTNGYGLLVYIVLAVGNNYHGTDNGQWNDVSNFVLGTSSNSNGMDAVNNEFYLTGIQLEIGTTATSFDRRPFATELNICYRYCYAIYNDNYYVSAGLGYHVSTAYLAQWLQFPTQMRLGSSIASTHNVSGWATSAPTGTNLAFITAASGTYVSPTGGFSGAVILGQTHNIGYLYAQAGSNWSGSNGDCGYFLIGPDVRLVWSAEF